MKITTFKSYPRLKCMHSHKEYPSEILKELAQYRTWYASYQRKNKSRTSMYLSLVKALWLPCNIPYFLQWRHLHDRGAGLVCNKSVFYSSLWAHPSQAAELLVYICSCILALLSSTLDLQIHGTYCAIIIRRKKSKKMGQQGYAKPQRTGIPLNNQWKA